ncbi:MAG: prephenate dehydrogenase/arogenate dehydrogenase family protein [Chloroflexota bacterium]
MKPEEEILLSQTKITIVGLGLMGGSLALALRGKCFSLLGIDPDPKTREIAISQNIVDRVEEDIDNIFQISDLIILCTPVEQILNILEKFPQNCQNPCIVMDIGSTKVEIIKKMEKLPPIFDPIGCHPICGKEKLSIENAERTLYYSAPFIVTPLNRTSPRALSIVYQIISAIGGKLITLSPIEHDRILASTSHLPFIISSILALSTEPSVAEFIGPGFRSASRLAGTPSSMMLGVIMTNRDNLLVNLEKFQEELAVFISAISENDFDTIESSLISAQEKYNLLMGSGIK